MSFQILSKITVHEDEPLACHTTFHIGGNARFFAYPHNEEELRGLLDFAIKEDIPFFVIGNGSNILFSDTGFPGLIISMRRFSEKKYVVTEHSLVCSAGALLQNVIEYAKEHARGGLEFLTYIPGTVGGAIMRNTSFRGEGTMKAMSDIIQRISVIHTSGGDITYMNRDALSFTYRSCKSVTGIIIEAELNVYPRDRKEIEDEINKNYNYRMRWHDMSYPSGGCIFKNPLYCEYTAGQLIDFCGLKGYIVGGAKISDKHANFIVNYNSASARDVLQLIDIARSTVRKQFSIDLDLEMEYVA